jgi:hypothetical protein
MGKKFYRVALRGDSFQRRTNEKLQALWKIKVLRIRDGTNHQKKTFLFVTDYVKKYVRV